MPKYTNGGEVLLVDRVPQPQLGGDAIVEPLQDRQAVAAFGGGGEAEQLDGGEVVEHPLVRGGGRVMELVDDHDVEVVGGDRIEVGGVQALDRREDVLEPARASAPDPLLTERRIAQRVPERREALIEDLLPMSDEQQPRPVEALAVARVVERRHHGLTRAGRGDEQVAVVAVAAATARSARAGAPGTDAGGARSG